MIESICKKNLKHFFYEESENFLIFGKKKDNEVCIDFFLKALSEKNPDENQLVMIDTQDKFKKYENDPHLSMPVVTNAEEGVRTLDFLVSKMDRRYQTLSEHHAGDIAEYNRDPGTSCKMPFVTVIVNDFEDLAKSHKIKVEYSILKLVQKGIGTGFNLILSTQDQSRDKSWDVSRIFFYEDIQNRISSSKIESDESSENFKKLTENGKKLYQVVDPNLEAEPLLYEMSDFIFQNIQPLLMFEFGIGESRAERAAKMMNDIIRHG